MTRLMVLAEGFTEQAFSAQSLRPHLWSVAQIQVATTCIETARDAARGRTFRGGHGRSFALIERHVRQLLEDRAGYVTTMLDLYGLPPDFPGLEYSSAFADARDKTLFLEDAFAHRIGSDHFIPYLMQHEFEALLFSDPDAIATILGVSGSQAMALWKVRNSYESPEEIDDSPQTAPSKRLIKIAPSYARQKAVAGPLIASRIGLTSLRQACRHFSDWVSILEAIAA